MQLAMKTVSLKILTILIMITLSVVSVFGAFFPGTYERDSASMAAQGMGQDLVDLFLVIPLLGVSLILMIRGSRVWTLIYGGLLFYILYSFIIYSLGVHFNRLFLVYCATLGLSTFAFIIYMREAGKMGVSEWFEDAPVKTVSAYLIIVAAIFYILWLKSVIPAIIRDTVPAEVSAYDLPVNPVHVIDLSLALPGLIIAGILIRRKKDLGYLLASIGLVFMIILTIALAGMVVALVVRGINEDFTVATIFAALTLATILFALLLFRKIRPVSR
jgi:hypothetical protein